MLVSLIKKEKISNIILPNKCYGIYWIMDDDMPLASIEAIGDKWYLNSNNDAVIIEKDGEISKIELENYKFYKIYNKKTEKAETVYTAPTYDLTNEVYYMLKDTISVGNVDNCDIKINGKFDYNYIQIKFSNNNFSVSCPNDRIEVYVNNGRLFNEKTLNSGDIIFLYGIKIICINENGKPIIVVNNPNDIVSLNSSFNKIEFDNSSLEFDDLELDDAKLYSEDEYFHKKPRFKENIVTLDVAIDAPPTKQAKSDIPIILTVGPMVTSSAISLIYGYMTINNVINNGKSFWSAWPTFSVAILSLMATLGWPFITRWYNKKKDRKKEKYRAERYNTYLDGIMKKIMDNANIQKRIIIQNNPSIKDCMEIIDKKNTSFWNRKVGDEDFGVVSLGNGNIPMYININIPESHFQLEDDELLRKLSAINTELPVLEDVPIAYSFLDKDVTATIGEYNLNKTFIDQIIFQLCTLQSYDDVKIVVLTNKKNDSKWDYIKILPHAWSNDKTIRFYGTSKDEIREICYYLDNVFNQRISDDKKKNNKYPLYLIVTDDYKTVRNFEFIKKILDTEENMGFSLLIMNDKVYNLPATCDNFININSNYAEIFQNILNSKVQKFKIDFSTSVNMYKYCEKLANIPIEFNNDEDSLATKIGFLELYNVGKIEQLNVLNRWRENNPILSLQSLIGLGKGGEKIYLDLHEKYHGPHGLIAGMTGSGKSEFIATYVLSLAVNYHPYEVQFILIDYKGGGIAGAFENKETGIKIPHLIGTITNLDENEIKRSLASIESELTRRQIVFKQVREKLGDSVVDIYKYQQLYRDGLVDTPISHLFIICDEFAELKSQQPEFLQQLISISRIGRSLGIHLILATQKPSGVVDNQIWSNSKFRVCLRVQEKSDSMEVIKTPDAAFLKNAGRFYLQVGYNEVFISGQAAWAGCKYVPTDKLKLKNDYNVDFVNNVGYVVKKYDTNKKQEVTINYGEEIKNIVIHLSELAVQEKIETNNLWLDKMPPYININELKHKYNFIKEPYILDIPVGEYDIPNKQMQRLLTVSLYRDDNVLIYGSQGSGKENFITTMLYSSITSYTTSELIYYVLDFGSGSLKVFSGIPHIGDVITSGENEKIENLFKMLYSMLSERKSRLSQYGGNYNIFASKSKAKMPRVVVIINNYDAYAEVYSQYEEQLIQLTRECSGTGMHFVIAVSNPSMIRSKLRQNFKQNYVLQQNNIADYSNILGNVHKMYPSNIFGRGIVKFDDIYEFQTAMVSERGNIFNYIEQIKPMLDENISLKARKVPTLPNNVVSDHIAHAITQDGKIVIGIDKENLSAIKFDIKRNFVNLFTGYDLELYNIFLPPLLKQIEQTNCFQTIIFNCEKLNITSDDSIIYTSNFDDMFSRMYGYIDASNKAYIEQNYNREVLDDNNKLIIIVGLDALKSNLTLENSVRLGSLFEKSKDLGNINFIIVDTIEKIRKFEFEPWYKTVVNNTRGIFLGNGLMDQMVLKITKNDRSLRGDIPYNFCYVVDHGRPILVKYVEIFLSDTFKKNTQ